MLCDQHSVNQLQKPHSLKKNLISENLQQLLISYSTRHQSSSSQSSHTLLSMETLSYERPFFSISLLLLSDSPSHNLHFWYKCALPWQFHADTAAVDGNRLYKPDRQMMTSDIWLLKHMSGWVMVVPCLVSRWKLFFVKIYTSLSFSYISLHCTV